MTEKNRKKTIRIIFSSIVLICLLAACGNESKEASTDADEDELSTEIVDDQETSSDSNTQEETTNIQDDLQTNNHVTEDEEAAKDDTKNEGTEHPIAESLKEDYLGKLNETKIEAEKLEAQDSSTYALKAVEDYRYEIWDNLLNEIYSVLQEKLSAEEMEKLRAEQREWIEYRDATALEASKEYEGGTQEHLEYSAVLANLTEERCYALVEIYMR